MSDQTFRTRSKAILPVAPLTSTVHTECRECGKHVVVTVTPEMAEASHLHAGEFVRDWDGYGICNYCATFAAGASQRAE